MAMRQGMLTFSHDALRILASPLVAPVNWIDQIRTFYFVLSHCLFHVYFLNKLYQNADNKLPLSGLSNIEFEVPNNDKIQQLKN